MRPLAAATFALALLGGTGPSAAAEAAVCIEGSDRVVARVCLKTDAPQAYPYGHRVLGDTPEWTTLHVTYAAPDTGEAGPARTGSVTLDRAVFEDITPRLADLDGDGVDEIVVVRSGFDSGARLEVYRTDPEVSLLAATPPIGQRFRWLAPVGIADFDSDGRSEIAYVETPHLGKTLRVWRLAEGGLAEVGRMAGLSNHRIGEDHISGGVRTCAGRPEMVTADASWRVVVAAGFDAGTLVARVLGPMRGPESFAAALACAPVD